MDEGKNYRKDLLREFDRKGYIIQRGIYSEEDFEELFFAFYDLALSCAKRNNIFIDYFPTIEEVSYQKDLKRLDELLISLLKKNKSFIGEIYDALPLFL